MDDQPPPEFRIHQTAQENLSHDNPPQRSFDEEMKEDVTKDCPGWNNPDVKKTYVIPPTFPDIPVNRDNKGERTEKYFYDILTEFGEKTKQPMIVVHSCEFKELVQCFEKGTNFAKDKESYWLKGEHDFVVIHRICGVIFFQVKAALKTGGAYTKAVQQIKKDQGSLTATMKRLSLKEDQGKIEEEMTKYPGFAVMPNCSRQLAGNRKGCFKEDCKTADAFDKWWKANIVRRENPEFSQEMYELMVIRFAAPLMTSCLQSVVLDNTHKRLIKLTKDQLSIMMGDCPQQYIKGPAGSGKTWLLMEKAKQLARIKPNEEILIMCFNRPLSMYLAKEFHHFPNVSVKTFVSLLLGIKGGMTSLNGLSEDEKKKLVFDCVKKLPQVTNSKYKYEHVFVDEGQDMFGIWWELVDLLHMDSDDDRRYKWVFFDNNQNVQIMGPKTNITRKMVNSAKEMNRIVRNTLNIFECSKKYLSPTLGAEIGHGVTGRQVKWVDSLSGYTLSQCLQQGTEIVRKEVSDLQRDRVTMSDIVVLTRDTKVSEKVCQDLSEGSPCIQTQDAEEAIESPNHAAVTVDSLRRFKGLERQVVILLDPPFNDQLNMELNYVGMSRCFCLLIIVTSKEKRKVYEEFTFEC